MAVKRIVMNIATDDVARAQAFYGDILGMSEVMNLGWICTYAEVVSAPAQISVASEGGSGTPVPDVSIEVDNLDDVHQRLLGSEFVVEYGPVIEPWGVRRFYVRDPFERLVSILEHV